MISLFSSFDLAIFYFNYILFFLIILGGLVNLFYSVSFLKKIYLFISKFLSGFFSSLNNSNFSKGLDFLILMMFILIFFFNFFSNFPFVFAFSSQPSFIFSLSFLSWSMIFFFSLIKNFKNQISHFIPESSPLGLSPFLFLIEMVSSFIRSLTLMVRLVANILSGHLLIILLSTLVSNFNFCFPLLSFLNLVELCVSIIQSYIFATLVTLYYSEI